MASITHQKHDLRESIHARVMACYAVRPHSQYSIAEGLLRRLTSRMSLGELKTWRTELDSFHPKVIPDV